MARRRHLPRALLFFTVLLGIPGGRCSERSDLSPPSLLDSIPYTNDIETISPRSNTPHNAPQEPAPSQPYDTDIETILQQQKNPFSLPLVLVESELYSKDLESNLDQMKSLASLIEERENEPYDIDFESILQEQSPLATNQSANIELESFLPESSSNISPGVVEDKSEPYRDDIESNVEATRPSASTVETDDETNVQRDKRSSGQEWDNNAKAPVGAGSRRVHTGDTILNIRGAVRDAIGDAGAAPGPRASSRLDTFVIRGAARARPARPPYRPPPPDQVPARGRELVVSPQARARIPCDLRDATNVSWYKDDEPVPLSGRAESGAVWAEGAAAVVGRATRADAGAWRCADRDTRARGDPVHLLIHEAVRSVYLAVDGRRLDAGNTWVPVRDKTELEVKCVAEGGVPPPSLSWRLAGLEPALDHRPYLRVHHSNYSIEGVSTSVSVVTAARELHNATLQCEAKQRLPATPAAPAPPAAPAAPAEHDVLAAKLEIHVTYPPSFVISRWPGFGVALAAGGAAALRCDVDANPPARAWWLRDDDNPTSSPPPLESGGSATLRWAALSTQHAGWYRCRASWLHADYSSIGYYLNVIPAEELTEPATEASTAGESGGEPGETETEGEPEHQKVEVPAGGNVQLHCPKGSVGCWWRKVVGNSSEAWAPAGSHHAHGVLGIKDAVYQEGGEYRCVGARGAGREAGRLRELKRVTLRVGGGATAHALSAQPALDQRGGGWRLECGACGRGVRVLWLRARRAPEPAALAPDLAQHCWRAVLRVLEPDEVWCVAATAAGGAVAVFPPRAPHPSPAPARHSVRAPFSSAVTSRARLAALALSLSFSLYSLAAL